MINNILHIEVEIEQDINEYFASKSQEILELIHKKYIEHILNEFTYTCFINILNIFYNLLDYN